MDLIIERKLNIQAIDIIESQIPIDYQKGTVEFILTRSKVGHVYYLFSVFINQQTKQIKQITNFNLNGHSFSNMSPWNLFEYLSIFDVCLEIKGTQLHITALN